MPPAVAHARAVARARAIGRHCRAHPPVKEKAAAAPSRHARTASPSSVPTRGGEGRRCTVVPAEKSAAAACGSSPEKTGAAAVR
jgi:hypothetical protein